jgi:hypothetical protein
MSPLFTAPSFAFEAAATASAAVHTNGVLIEGLYIPAGWTAANITFQVSEDGTTWSDLYDIDGGPVSAAPVAGTAMMVPPAMLRGFSWMRLVSSVAQVSAVSIAAVARRGG